MKVVIEHFEAHDPLLAPIVAAAFAGDKPIALREPIAPELYFQELAEAVVNQQLSTKAAATIWRRFSGLLDGEITPERVLALTPEQFQSVGVSRQKAGYLHAMAQAITDGQVRLEALARMSDDEVVTELTKLKGIGPWTAEMFLMFALGRPDVFSYLDLGLVRAFERVYEKPGALRNDMEPIVATWAPYRTYAALALWRHRDSS